jgi:hypothetical protein
VVSFTPWPLYPREKTPGTQWLGDWVGPRAILDVVVKIKIPIRRRESNPRTPIVQPGKMMHPKVSGLAAWSENCKW